MNNVGHLVLKIGDPDYDQKFDDNFGVELPSAYFRKIEKLIGKKQLAEEKYVAIVIWKYDIPIKILAVQSGELVNTDVYKWYPEYDPFQIISAIESEIKSNPLEAKMYDIVLCGDDFKFYDDILEEIN